nr:MAG TPA: hypothetical protein [Caudoviricetes sp.]
MPKNCKNKNKSEKLYRPASKTFVKYEGDLQKWN